MSCTHPDDLAKQQWGKHNNLAQMPNHRNGVLAVASHRIPGRAALPLHPFTNVIDTSHNVTQKQKSDQVIRIQKICTYSTSTTFYSFLIIYSQS
jgi:hypothetical protein